VRGNIVFEGEQAFLPEDDVLKISGRISETPVDEWGEVLESLQVMTPSKVVKQKKYYTNRTGIDRAGIA